LAVPKLPQPDSRMRIASFRISTQERQQLLNAANERGITFSDYARMLILGQPEGGNTHP
jgi:hypothetical protein